MARKNAYNYFDEFVKLVGYSCDGAEILNRTLRDFNPETVAESMNALHDIEHSADDTKHWPAPENLSANRERVLGTIS